MPIATTEQIEQFHVVEEPARYDCVYLTDAQCAASVDHSQKYYGRKKSIDEVMRSEIVSCGMDPSEFLQEGSRIALRAGAALVFVALRKKR